MCYFINFLVKIHHVEYLILQFAIEIKHLNTRLNTFHKYQKKRTYIKSIQYSKQCAFSMNYVYMTEYKYLPKLHYKFKVEISCLTCSVKIRK